MDFLRPYIDALRNAPQKFLNVIIVSLILNVALFIICLSLTWARVPSDCENKFDLWQPFSSFLPKFIVPEKDMVEYSINGHLYCEFVSQADFIKIEADRDGYGHSRAEALFKKYN